MRFVTVPTRSLASPKPRASIVRLDRNDGGYQSKWVSSAAQDREKTDMNEQAARVSILVEASAKRDI